VTISGALFPFATMAVRKPRRLAVLEAERAIKLKALERERKRRVQAVRKANEEGARRQREQLAELGVEDWHPRDAVALVLGDD
jgi:hypothetical protein